MIVVHFIGSPAVVDVRAEKPGDEAAIAVAGPLTSLVLGVVAVALALLCVASGVEALGVVGEILVIVGALDLVLAGGQHRPGVPARRRARRPGVRLGPERRSAAGRDARRDGRSAASGWALP